MPGISDGKQIIQQLSVTKRFFFSGVRVVFCRGIREAAGPKNGGWEAEMVKRTLQWKKPAGFGGVKKKTWFSVEIYLSLRKNNMTMENHPILIGDTSWNWCFQLFVFGGVSLVRGGPPDETEKSRIDNIASMNSFWSKLLPLVFEKAPTPCLPYLSLCGLVGAIS